MRRRLCSTLSSRVDALVRHVDVRHVEGNAFSGKSVDLGWGRVYGGQTMAQAVSAAQAVAGANRDLHQFTAHFLKGGDVARDILFDTDVLSGGRSFTVVHVRAKQQDRAILSLTASFQAPELGLESQTIKALQPEWRRPDELQSLEEHMAPYLERMPKRLARLYMDGPIEIRPSTFAAPWDESHREPQRAFWVRLRGGVPDDPRVHQRLLTYISDWGLLETALLPLPTAAWLPHMQVASLTHSVHFHHPSRFRLDGEWLCHVMTSPVAAGARGYAMGEVWTEGGLLVASTSQEGLIRRREDKLGGAHSEESGERRGKLGT